MKLQLLFQSRYQVFIFMLTLIAALIGVYYFVYVEKKREYQHQRAFRNLTQDGMPASHPLQQLARNLTIHKVQVEKQFAYLKDSNDSLNARLHQRMMDSVVAGQGQYLHRQYQPQVPSWTETGKAYAYAEFYPKLRLRPLYNQFVADNYLLLQPVDSLNAWQWRQYSAKQPDNLETISLTYWADASGPLTLSAMLPGLEPSYLLSGSWLRFLLLVTALVLLLGLLHGLIRYTVTQLFSFAVFEELHRSVGAANPFGPRKENDPRHGRCSAGDQRAAIDVLDRRLAARAGGVDSKTKKRRDGQRFYPLRLQG
jgi:hypothetical protein